MRLNNDFVIKYLAASGFILVLKSISGYQFTEIKSPEFPGGNLLEMILYNANLKFSAEHR